MGFGQPRSPQERSLDLANRIVDTLNEALGLLLEDGASSSTAAANVSAAIRDRIRVRDKRRAQLAQRREGER